MSTIPDRQMRVGATAGDCGRLWLTLTKEYIPDLRMSIVPLVDDSGPTGIKIEVVSDGVYDQSRGQVEDVWASASYFNQLHLISAGSLFELLITAHRRIDEYFRLGESHGPIRRVK